MANRATHPAVDTVDQLELFDVGRPAPARPLVPDERRSGSNGDRGASTAEATSPETTRSHASADGVVLRALEEALAVARTAGDERPAPVVLAAYLGDLGAPPTPAPALGVSLRQARDEWLPRLEAQQRSESTLVGYRVAIDDLLAWSKAHDRDVLEEASIVDYLRSYRERASPKQSTYYRRFVLLRRFLRWVSSRHGLVDPFHDLEPPPKPRQESDSLTPRSSDGSSTRLATRSGTFPAWPSATSSSFSPSSSRGCDAPRSAPSTGGTFSSMAISRRCSSAVERAARHGASRYRPASRVSCRGSPTLTIPSRPTPSSVASRADGCSRRSSPTSSTVGRRSRPVHARHARAALAALTRAGPHRLRCDRCALSPLPGRKRESMTTTLRSNRPANLHAW